MKSTISSRPIVDLSEASTNCGGRGTQMGRAIGTEAAERKVSDVRTLYFPFSHSGFPPKRGTCRADVVSQCGIEQQQVAAPRIAAGVVGNVAQDAGAGLADLGPSPALGPPTQNLARK